MKRTFLVDSVDHELKKNVWLEPVFFKLNSYLRFVVMENEFIYAEITCLAPRYTKFRAASP